jgi:hypothetical protein
MKRSLLFLIFLALTLSIKGQQKYLDNVFLKNGRIVRGVIIEQVLNKSVRIVSTEGDSLNFKMDEIEKITSEPISDKKKRSECGSCLKPGYKLIIQGSLFYGIGKFGINNEKLSIINGIRLNRKFAIGFGAGLGFYSKPKLDFASENPLNIAVPVFLDLRTNFPIGKKVSGYSAFDIGYSFSKKSEFNGYINGFGILLNLMAGISIRTSNKSSFQLAIAYELQKRTFVEINNKNYSYDEIDKLVNCIGINAGINFF